MTQTTHLSTRLRALAVLAAAALCTGPARAGIDLRVQSRPNTGPIEAFVRVTDGGGPVTGLTAADFAITLDGAALSTFTFGLPPDQDPTQKSSIAFVLGAQGDTSIVTDFINQMAVGNYAAIIRFKPQIDNSAVDTVVQPFTQIDGGALTGSLIDFLATQYRSIFRAYDPLFHGLIVALDQFAISLSNGPKAIVLISKGDDRYTTETLSDVIASANRNSIPIFTIGVGDMAATPAATALMSSLAADTGGNYFDASNPAKIAEAYATISALLANSYRLTIPQAAVTDCNPHMLEVTSQGQSESIAFNRCDTTPEEFSFAGQIDVAPGTAVVSEAVTITGIESPVDVTVIGGEYSIGCGSLFTSGHGIILPEEKICVRHTASTSLSTSNSTLLIVGGVSSGFYSTTWAASPPPPPPIDVGGNAGGSNGGGGAVGGIELLLVLGALFARNRRRHQERVKPA